MSKFRVDLDNRNEKIGAKIRDAELKKVPIMLIIGENEASKNVVSVRRRLKGDLGLIKLDQLILNLNTEIEIKGSN